jgi:outer membrane protein assembly factor BamD (BamD/ComL family)
VNFRDTEIGISPALRLPFCPALITVSGMYQNKKIILAVIISACFAFEGLQAQTDSMDFDDNAWDSDSAESRYTGLSRKSGTVFRRPRKETPAAQLVYAESLLAEGRLRFAARQFNALVHRWPDADEAASAQQAFARVMLQRGRYERAFREFQYLIEHYTGLFPYKAVLEEQLAAARGVMEQRRGGLLILPGFESPERAIPLFRIIITNGPNWAETPALRLLIGKIHEKEGDFSDAVAAYEEVIMHHGRQPVAREAVYRKAICLERIATRYPRDEQRTRTALQAMFAALREDLEPAQAEEAQALVASLRTRLEEVHFEKAAYYDRMARNPVAALISYREFLNMFPHTDRHEAVTARIRELEAQQGERE